MNKFGPFERMGTRETQRRAWREAVARAAAMMTDEVHGGWYTFKGKRCRWRRGDAVNWLRAALSAPKPWARPAEADLGKWRQIETLRRDTRIGPSGMTFREFCRIGGGSRSVYRGMDSLRRKRRAAQRRRR